MVNLNKFWAKLPVWQLLFYSSFQTRLKFNLIYFYNLITKYEWPKMKRDARCSYFVKALIHLKERIVIEMPAKLVFDSDVLNLKIFKKGLLDF